MNCRFITALSILVLLTFSIQLFASDQESLLALRKACIRKQTNHDLINFERALIELITKIALPRSADLKTLYKLREDEKEPNLLVLDDLPSEKYSTTEFAAELQTARDYAKFLKHHRKALFVFLSEFQGKSVPIFDGFIVNEAGERIENVSLKYASVSMSRISMETFLESMMGRLDHDMDLKRFDSPLGWLRAFGGGQSILKITKSKTALDIMQQTASVLGLLDLFKDGQYSLLNRGLRTVLDVRNHGYPFEWIEKPDILSSVVDLIRKTPHQFALTLLWDSEHVIEFDARGYQVHKPKE
ncbi:MAG: hypothetical protein J0L93_00665 [Deltaproteobacteria bacterium]|nr:hypothetical protein [Deltaproteobacteria bacterium]